MAEQGVSALVADLAAAGVRRRHLAAVAELEARDVAGYLARQMAWSRVTFGEGRRTIGLVKHIGKELAEIEANPSDLAEWVDVIILALDGYWRHGGTPDRLMADLQGKQDTNRARTWPSPGPEDEPIEHDRTVGPGIVAAVPAADGECVAAVSDSAKGAEA